jgi:serine/threonine-protein kinase
LVQAPPAFDETVPAGTVISWMVPEQPGLKAGDTVIPGTAVAVVVSAGPQPRVVPNLTGMSVEDATAALAAQGLVLAQLEPEFNDVTAAGLIARQDPAADATVDRGATISVAVSKGQDLVGVPPLANLTLQQATDTLSAAGLTVGVVSGNPAGVLVAAQVQGVDVLPGQLFTRGTAIDIALL